MSDRDRAIPEPDVNVALPCHDRRRLWSPAVTRAFVSVVHTSSLGAQSEASPPTEVTLDPDAMSDTAIQRERRLTLRTRTLHREVERAALARLALGP